MAPPSAIHASRFSSHEELRGALAAFMSRGMYDAIFMTAAVSDYKPRRTYEVVGRRPNASGEGMETWVVRDAQAGKISSAHREIAVLGERTEKLVDLFRTEWAFGGVLVKFKLEVGITRDALLKIGESSRVASEANYLVANTLDMVDGPGAGAFLLSDAAPQWVPRAELADRMVRLVSKAAWRSGFGRLIGRLKRRLPRYHIHTREIPGNDATCEQRSIKAERSCACE